MKQLFTWILCLASGALSAQEVTVSSTAEYTNNLPGAYWTKTLGQDASGYYLIREGGPISQRTILLEKYSPDMKLLFSSNIESASGVMGNSLLHRFTEMNKGRVTVFMEGWSKADGKNSFYVKEMAEDGSWPDKGILLETEPSPGQLKSADYSVSFSPDGSKLLVLTEKPFVKGEREKLRLQVFSTDTYSSLWKQDLTLENESARGPDNTIVVDNEGTAYMFKDVKITNKEHIYQLITTGKDFSKTTAINLGTYYPTQQKLLIDNSGKLVIAGMLAVQGKSSTNWQGMWNLSADREGNILQNTTEPLGSDMLRLMVSEKAAQQEGYSLDNFVLKDVLLKPAGGILLLAEKQVTNRTTVPQSVPPVYQYELQYGDIAAISFDADGKRLWNTVIEKRQAEFTMEPTMRYGSFAYQLKGNDLYLVWNYTDLRNDAPIRNFRYWIDRNGSKINIDNIFGREALYPTLLTVIRADGSFLYSDRTFSALPLEAIQKPNAFPMAVDPNFFFNTADGMIIMSRMPGIEAKRYKFNVIKY